MFIRISGNLFALVENLGLKALKLKLESKIIENTIVDPNSKAPLARNASCGFGMVFSMLIFCCSFIY